MHVHRDMSNLVAIQLPINIYVSPCQNYRTMDDKDKRPLVTTYMKHGGIKQLGWVANYFENSSSTSKEKHVRFFRRSQDSAVAGLQKNGMVPEPTKYFYRRES